MRLRGCTKERDENQGNGSDTTTTSPMTLKAIPPNADADGWSSTAEENALDNRQRLLYVSLCRKLSKSL
jgi:hypothetical protein